jgi:hypothetical protein
MHHASSSAFDSGLAIGANLVTSDSSAAGRSQEEVAFSLASELRPARTKLRGHRVDHSSATLASGCASDEVAEEVRNIHFGTVVLQGAFPNAACRGRGLGTTTSEPF